MKEFWISIQLIFSAVGGWLGYFLGGCDGLLYTLLAFVVLDYVTGIMCAVADKKLSSAIGFKGIFKSKRDTFRRFRDLSILSFAGVYLLSVIDAYVDAELSSFDISHDLSLEIHPTMIETGRFDMHHRTTTPGVQCVINF